MSSYAPVPLNIIITARTRSMLGWRSI
ncbi:hypothetical protein CRUP_026606 [Coryphaenoides rupestris]|nr:hypothetical protein CRUP_026606 [Coryphaenoides rupestris]